MASIVASGITQVQPYSLLVANYPITATLFLVMGVGAVENALPRLYGDIIQRLPNYPIPGKSAEIGHKRVWLDCVELDFRRDFGSGLPTELWVLWRVNDVSYVVYQV